MARPSARTKDLATWLETRLAELAPGANLPTDAQLARAWSLSASTVKRVLSHYRDRGMLERIQGKGTFKPPGRPHLPCSTERHPSSVRALAENLQSLVYAGKYAYGEQLPSIKFMCLQYKLAPATVVAAYRQLADMQLLTKIGKSFYVGTSELFQQGVRKRREVVCYYGAGDDFTDMFNRNELAPAYRKMERELLRFGYVLKHDTLGNAKKNIRISTRTGRLPAGIILAHLSAGSFEMLRSTIDRMYRKAVSPPRCLVVGPYVARFNRNISFVNEGQTTTARFRACAQFIHRKGFKTVSLILDQSAWPHTHALVCLKLRTALATLYGEGLRFRFAVLPSQRRMSRAAFMDKEFSYYAPLHASNLTGGVSRTQIEKEMVVCASMGQVLKRLEHGKGHVWVFANDACAEQAYTWLRDSGIRIPEDMSIIGLENNPRYFSLGITSVTKDFDTMGCSMAHAIIGDIPLARTSSGALQTYGLVLERQTT